LTFPVIQEGWLATGKGDPQILANWKRQNLYTKFSYCLCVKFMCFDIQSELRKLLSKKRSRIQK